MSSSQYYQWLWEFLNLYSSDDNNNNNNKISLFGVTLSLSLFVLLHVMGRTRDSVMGTIWSGHVARMCSASKVRSETTNYSFKHNKNTHFERLVAIGCFGAFWRVVLRMSKASFN
jgi:hypothetical protein